jgi:hypothetical protein
VTEPDPKTLAEAIRNQDRADRDEDIAEELDVTDKVAQELADSKDEPCSD